MPEDDIKIVVVEDEMLIGAKISLFLSELGYEVTGLLPRAEEVLYHLKENKPDIALLDIQLKGSMDGIELAQVLQKEHNIPIVFLTANTDDATFQRAKATKPYAFLSKPFKKLDLKRALELTISLMSNLSLPPQEKIPQNNDSPLTDRIFVHYKEKKVKIMLDSILYIAAERNYCRIVTTSTDYLLSMPMKSLEQKLPARLFQRIHRSHIVNLKHLDEVDENTVVVGGKTLNLSKSYQKQFLQRIRAL